jgi:exosome complex component RRP4
MDKKIVIPGDLISANTRKAGYGTYVKNNKIYSSFCGIENLKDDKAVVTPLEGVYIPSVNDVVIGIVIVVTPSNWIMDIASPYDGLFHVSEYPRRLESRDMPEILNVGDSMIIRVKDVDSSMKIELGLRDSNFHKLKTGQIVEVEPVKVPRVIGHGGSMISMLKKETNCSIFVGQNGRIWIDGKDEDVELLSKALWKIEAEAQRSGLTDRIYNFLKSERFVQKESSNLKFFENAYRGAKLANEDNFEDIYRKIDVLLDPKN